MKRLTGPSLMGVLTILSLVAGASPAPAAEAATARLQDAKCLKCHGEYQGRKDLVAGDFQSRSNKAQTMAVAVGDSQVVIKFTPQTRVVNAQSIKDLKKPIPVRVTFVRQGEDMVASEVVAKPQIKVPEEQLINVDQVAALVAQGPEKGRYMLLDSRPPIRFQEGAIPTAVSMPFPAMPKMLDKLPKDKSTLLVFYCGGFR